MERDKAEIRRLKIRAREAANRAEKSGQLVKPDSCQGCGEPATALVKHHTDYTKSLDIEWLCEGCHEDRHAGDLSEQQLGFVFSRRRAPRYDPLGHLRDLEFENFPMEMEF